MTGTRSANGAGPTGARPAAERAGVAAFRGPSRSVPPSASDELVRFVDRLSPPPVAVPRELSQLLDYIHGHLFDPLLNVDGARSSCGILDNNVSCRFRSLMGLSIRDYIEGLRLEAARRLLERPELSVFEVTSLVGYSYPQTFYRAFRRRFRSTPSAYRTRHALRATRGGDTMLQPLSPEDRRDLIAAADRILPGEDGPGATEANVIGFFDWAMQQPSFARERECLVKGLGVLASVADAVCARRFADCGPAERDSVLRQIQLAPHPTAQRFLSALVDMTLAGFLCHPRRGGNRRCVGWKYIDFRPHPFTWSSGRYAPSREH